MKTTKTLVSLLLVAVTVLTLPLAALATTYSGTYGSISWTVNTGGSTSSLYSKIQTSSKASLSICPNARIHRMVNGESVYVGTAEIVANSTGLVKSFTLSLTYSQFRTKVLSDNPTANVPTDGFFKQCNYNDKINMQAVVSNALEVFA